jgi:hypothetical protein
VIGTIELGGGPEFAVTDGKGTVYVNLEDQGELVAIDSGTLKIKSRWQVAPAGAPTALARGVVCEFHPALFESLDCERTLYCGYAHLDRESDPFPPRGLLRY